MSNRRHISRAKRAKLFMDKGGICHMCGQPIRPGEAWDVSHPLPLALGGADDESNWDLAHKKCHQVATATEDVPRIAKMKRQRDKHNGAIRPRSSLSGRNPPQRRATKPLTKWAIWRET